LPLGISKIPALDVTPTSAMRIYLFIEHFPNPYKPWIDTQVVTMLRAGHEVTILAEGAYRSTINDEIEEYRLEERAIYYPATLRTLPQHAVRVLSSVARRPVAQVSRAIRVADRAQDVKLNLLAAARAALMPADEPDICYVHNLVTASRLTFLRSLYPKTRVCLYFHGGEVGGQPMVRGERRVFDAVDAVVTNTRFSAAQAVARGCRPEKIAMIPMGFHLPDYTPSTARIYRPDGVLRLVSVGRMSPEKGHIHVLEAIRRLLAAGIRRFTYKLIGAGILHAKLQDYVRNHDLSSVVSFLGERKKNDVARELEASDVLVLPSITTESWAETQATVVQEALLMKCLTLTTDAGGVPESNAPVMRRFSVPPSDPDAIAAKIREILVLDRSTLEALGREARAFAAANYDIAALMPKILEHALGRLPPDDPARYLPAAATNHAL
jgi:colanic acid/amylovoran biosynthesis glycosyltransferase